ncbi:phospho-N-acetylmuramoyl-pentapeptide-transferase [Anaeromyxobacter sp. K]|uniref:Phospho-N-acetylmuramoyl-pentapeptide-transferase n=3 Tax=Anaeromyxobacter TaxID=161492 RepID=MRAY_ANADE|nr:MULTISPECIES: phospho-N-acetylmuramoyl-pentapeptide-transferase [Anaeromyxobacter]B4UER8.1 RecName: Full=Phospho-N-acetylmuramoyl-pentapeptide-transferase; AltName: Full=UDP-MurNAc-pentapeptide phosphotransferase [Anaeromyxobacter sp. K]B8J8E5.1 RecName: Full=Phospho-N-acetylmuramoyl-pentapeptide-transferase; AltName: Full=UDP-MurNAc-pentapeptide phosphotransferase [Anaeromyxobacter dehalogenans 2CP-1]Q2IG26.1 RecName: Full=Phospho-N-acetylmuramoyl-pentapeptide-transferase; AltName: Full=UDP-
MLYHLLYPLAYKLSLLNVLRYPSFRIVAAGLTAMVLGLLLGPIFIERMRVLQYGSTNVREDTPDTHKKKAGTPSMGGALILASVAIATLLFADLANRFVWAALLVTLGYGAIGFTDDWLKISKKNSKGLAGKKKLVLQVLVVVVVYYACLTDWRFHVEHRFPWVFVGSYVDLHVTLPFVPSRLFNPDLGFLYLPFMVFVVIATSNAVNLTDGLDGLAIGPTVVSAMTFLALSYVAGATIAGFSLAEYLRVPYIPGAEELGVFCSAIFGAGVAFLWYNTYPASVFMGDVGSLALGGGLGMMAVLTKNEFASAILHGVFLTETVSVILQVWSFKTTGKRIFRMAPIHHHYELKGWAEPKIIVRFWIISVMLALVALLSIKLR